MSSSALKTIESESLRLLLQAGRWIWTIHIPAVTGAVAFLWDEPYRNQLLIWYVVYCGLVFAQRYFCMVNI
ncbi:MAG: hypothetical protein AAF387_16265 [Pseudomonadota bacterium]